MSRKRMSPAKQIADLTAALEQMTQDWHAAERRVIALQNEIDAIKAPKDTGPADCWSRPTQIIVPPQNVTAWDQAPRIG